jgi:DNA uptake protein ComE-like DNA-binding protein
VAEPSAKARGVPYVTAAGLALALWAWAMVRLLGGGCEEEGEPVAPLVVDLNSADEGLLRTLPGIGKVLAARIVAEREANGPFGKPGDLLRVRGATRELVEGIEPSVTCGGAEEPGRTGP